MTFYPKPPLESSALSKNRYNGGSKMMRNAELDLIRNSECGIPNFGRADSLLCWIHFVPDRICIAIVSVEFVGATLAVARGTGTFFP